jgi:hypothetical protein
LQSILQDTDWEKIIVAHHQMLQHAAQASTLVLTQMYFKFMKEATIEAKMMDELDQKNHILVCP